MTLKSTEKRDLKFREKSVSSAETGPGHALEHKGWLLSPFEMVYKDVALVNSVQ